MKYKTKKLKISLLVIICILLVLAGIFYIYTLDYYRADENALRIYSEVETEQRVSIFYPDEKNDIYTGFIFYPGGKVEAAAYAPLLKAISDEGITCILLEMPFNLAVFDINAANKVFNDYPNIKKWYLGGHSLGGAMASSYVKNNSEKLKGLILLGAYPINDSSIPTLAIFGTEDEGLNMSKLVGVKNKLEILGGNHAYFGNYGEQKGDGVASITREEQQSVTIKSIIQFIN